MNKKLVIMTVAVVLFFVVASAIVFIIGRQRSIQQEFIISQEEINKALSDIEEFEDMDLDGLLTDETITPSVVVTLTEAEKTQIEQYKNKEIDSSLAEIDKLVKDLNGASDFADFGSLD